MAEPTDQLLYIAARFAPKIRDALLQSYRDFLGRVSESVIIDALKRNGLQGLVDLANTLGGDLAANVSPMLHDAWIASGRQTIQIMPAGTFSDRVIFDALPVGAVSAAELHRANLILELTATQRNTVVEAIAAGIITGDNPVTTAREFRSLIGLTAQQELAVANYRSYLEELNPEALQRALRDHRFDATIARAIAEGELLDSDYVDNLVERYRQRTLKYRAEMISRTESLRAVHMGEYDSLLAAHREGKISPFLRRFWVATVDDRTRDAHIVVPQLNPQGRAIDEMFQTPLGPLRYPLDPEGSAANVIQCRCRLVYRIVQGTLVFGESVPSLSVYPESVANALSIRSAALLGI